MRKCAIAAIAGIASAALLSAEASASDFQTRFGHGSGIGADGSPQSWGELNYRKSDNALAETTETELDVGFDAPLAETGQGRWWGGAYVRYSRSDVESSASCESVRRAGFNAGGVNISGPDVLRLIGVDPACPGNPSVRGGLEGDLYGVAATLAWIGHSGAYFDFQAGHFAADVELYAGTIRSRVGDIRQALFLAELGRKFEAGGGFFITPSAGIEYNSLDHDLIPTPNVRQIYAGVLASYEPAEGRRLYGEINIGRLKVSSFEETLGELGFGGNFPLGGKANLSLGLSTTDVLDSFGDDLSLIGSAKLSIPF